MTPAATVTVTVPVALIERVRHSIAEDAASRYRWDGYTLDAKIDLADAIVSAPPLPTLAVTPELAALVEAVREAVDVEIAARDKAFAADAAFIDYRKRPVGARDVDHAVALRAEAAVLSDEHSSAACAVENARDELCDAVLSAVLSQLPTKAGA